MDTKREGDWFNGYDTGLRSRRLGFDSRIAYRSSWRGDNAAQGVKANIV